MSATGAAAPPAPTERALPPVRPLAIATLALVVVGGIFMAAHIPNAIPLGPPIALLSASAVLLVVNVVLLARVHPFAWHTFFLVGRWTLLAYLIIAGMLEYVFAYDHTPGRELVLVSLMLVVFAVDVPLLLGFSVARYQDPDGA